MARGGKRSGAGRKAGVPNKITADNVAKAAASGDMPLDIMLKGMRGEICDWQQKRDENGRLMYEADMTDDKLKMVPVMEYVPLSWDRRFALARQAAPYLHPRLESVEWKPVRDLSHLTDDQIRELIELKRKQALILGK